MEIMNQEPTAETAIMISRERIWGIWVRSFRIPKSVPSARRPNHMTQRCKRSLAPPIMRVKPDHIIMSPLFSGVKMSNHPKNAIQSKAISSPKKFLINRRQNIPNTKNAPEDHCVHSSSTDVSRKEPSRIGAG